jgi:hypothetical protein
MKPRSHFGIKRIVVPAIVWLIAGVSGGTLWVSAREVAMSDSDSTNAKVLTEVLKKMQTGGKIEPSEFQDFVKAQNDRATTGLKVGERIPDFALPDQYGKQRKFRDLTGPAGLLLVFTRSADW